MTPLIVDCTIHHLTSLGQVHMFSRRERIYLHVHANVAISFSRILLPTTTTYRSLTSFLLYYCCSVNVFQNDNKMRVIQSLIVHDAIGKPKILLDQLREGLQTLGFGSRMQVYPELFKELFVAGEKEMKGSDIKEILMFPSEMSDAEKTIMEHMTEFIVGATPDILKAFLTFATGAPCLPEFGLGRIRIEFEDPTSIFSSTCTKNVTLPRNFPDKDTFLAALQAVCDNSGKAFTSI